MRIQDRRRVDTDFTLIMAQLDDVDPIRINQSIQEVFDRFMTDRDRIFFPVVDDIGFPVGLIHERDLKAIVYSMYGRDLLRNRRRTASSLAAFVKPCSVANINASTEKIIEIFNSVPETDGVLIVKESQYGGFLHARSLLKILNEKSIQIARDQNPLSKLAGNILIQEYLAAAASQDGSYHFAYLDFNFFKPFNDTYGFRTGDRAILMFADILRAFFGREGRFIGHVGGDDFFIGFSDIPHDIVMAEVRQAVEKFKTDVESLYAPDDRRNGYISGMSHAGRAERFPLLTTIGAVIHKPSDRNLPNLDMLSSLIANAKKAAKDSPERVISVEI